MIPWESRFWIARISRDVYHCGKGWHRELILDGICLSWDSRRTLIIETDDRFIVVRT